MYEKLVGKKVKAVYKDGKYTSITEGILTKYNEEIKTILITDSKGAEFYIGVLTIEKLVVLEDE